MELLGTGTRVLAEASPSDAVWGIGCSASNAYAMGRFPGKNLSGKAMMEVRDMLREEAAQREESARAWKQVLGG